jgi:hypothetical protein
MALYSGDCFADQGHSRADFINNLGAPRVITVNGMRTGLPFPSQKLPVTSNTSTLQTVQIVDRKA